MRILYFDCFSGAAGDMILGALVDAGDAVEQGWTQLFGEFAEQAFASWHMGRYTDEIAAAGKGTMGKFANELLATLVRVAGRRWTIEMVFPQLTKGRVRAVG